MGQYFTQPNTALSMPGGPAMAVGNPQQLAQAASSALPSADAMLGPDVLKPNQNAPELPFIRRPSVMEAEQAGARPGSGQGNVFSPGLSKGGKLLTLLTSGLQGALAGRAAQEQAAVQSGGRRAGGVGLGFEAGYAQPFQRQEQAAQAGLAQAGLQPVETPYGNLPAALATKIISPYLGYQGRLGAAQIGATGREQAAETGAAGGIQRAQIGAGARTGAAQISADARIRAAQLGLGPIADVPEDLQTQFGLPPQLPLRMLNQAESAANKPLTVSQGEAGPAIVNKQTGQTRSLGLGAPAQGRTVVVADPNNPGNLTYATAGQAQRTGAPAPGSAPTRTAQATARAVAPGGKVGEEINAFSTALQHANLLQDAAEALHNGDIQALNKLKNRFGNAFGSTGPITANTIASAYTREVTKMLSGGHMTDSELGQIGSTLDPTRQSLPQMQAVIGAYKALASSKMQVRQQGVEQGLRGRANFPGNQPATPAANDPLGIR